MKNKLFLLMLIVTFCVVGCAKPEPAEAQPVDEVVVVEEEVTEIIPVITIIDAVELEPIVIIEEEVVELEPIVIIEEEVVEEEDVNVIVIDKSDLLDELLPGINLSDIVPAFKQGIFYSVDNSKVQYVMTMEVAKWKDLLFEVGYSPEHTGIGAITYKVAKLKDLGVDTPILNLIEFNVGIAAGLKKIGDDNEFDWGPTITLINIKW